jgi:hypothetical protein
MEAHYSSEAVVFVSKIQRRLPPEGRSLECNWSCLRTVLVLGANAQSRKATTGFVMSVRPRITARLPVDEFLSDLILGTSTKVI